LNEQLKILEMLTVGKPGSDPIVVDVDDEDERLQVYIG
jgi:hypothetical protein